MLNSSPSFHRPFSPIRPASRWLPTGAALLAIACSITNIRAAVDASYDPGLKIGERSSDGQIALQPDGKLIIHGDFNAAVAPYTNPIRANVDGTYDTSYKIVGGGLSGNALSVLALPDGKSIVAGNFGGGATTNFLNDRHGLLRVNADGSQDFSFKPVYAPDPAADAAYTGSLNAVVRQPDGKLIVGGEIRHSQDGGAVIDQLMRLNADGSRDASFQFVTVPNAYNIQTIALQPDGKILLGVGATSRSVIRLNSDGTVDNTFQGFSTYYVRTSVKSLAVQPDGKILVGGAFRTVTPAASDTPENRYCLARLNPDGSTDLSFKASPNLYFFDASINAILLLADGKILVAGNLTLDPNKKEYGVRCLNVDGSLDANSAYNAVTDGPVDRIILQDNGGLFLAGTFHKVDGITRNIVARLGTAVGPVPKQADLTGGLAGSKAKLNKKGTKAVFTGTLAVTNSGDKAAKDVTVGVYLSDDGTFNVATDRFLGVVSLTEAGFPKIGKNGKIAGPVVFKFKANLSEIGTATGKRLILVVDPTNQVAERSESNNASASEPL